MRYRIVLSYSGAGFFGWQVQPGQPSIQQTLQDALSTLLRTGITVTGAGRTDTGVNAIGYTAHFDSPEEIDTDLFLYKLNAILPLSISVSGISRADDGFHSRFDATKREYTYFLHRVKDPFIKNYSLYYPFPLDFDKMNRCAGLLCGTHDFSCFEKTGADNKTSICTVSEAGWHTYCPTHCRIMTSDSYREGDYRYFRICADRFLRNMVRAVTGTLLDIGRGKRSEESFAELLDGGSRSQAGGSVPGNALFLSKIEYF